MPDLYDVLHARLRAAAATADVVLTSGGVSVGDHDLVKAVLQDAGGIDFWQVAMQPGRPLAVGRIGPALFFGLPGNPVASMLTFHLFVRPALWKLAGRRELFPPRFHAVAMEPMSKKPGRREFKRGILSYCGERWEVRTTGPQGSGILTSMTLANCFVVIEEERGDVAAGETVSVEPFAAGLSRMPHGIETRLIETITPMVRELVTTHARALADLRYADVRARGQRGQVRGRRERGGQVLRRRLRLRASASGSWRAPA